MQGVSYTSGNTTGTTGADGSFTYEIGQPVTFTLGGVVIGTATPTSTTTAILTPVDLVAGAANTTNATVQQIAVFLQTLDSDSNPANGIQINAATVLAAAGQVVDFTNPATVAAVLTAVAPNATVVTAAQVKTNMDNARLAATAGHYTGTWTATVAANGTVRGAGNSVLVGAFTVAGTATANGSVTMGQSQGGVSTGAVFRGAYNPYGGVSGSWVNGPDSGFSLALEIN